MSNFFTIGIMLFIGWLLNAPGAKYIDRLKLEPNNYLAKKIHEDWGFVCGLWFCGLLLWLFVFVLWSLFSVSFLP